MTNIKASLQKLVEIGQGLEKFSANLDPFIKAAEETDNALATLRETAKDLKVLDQETILRSEPAAQLLSEVETTVNNFYNYVRENEAPTINALGLFSPDVRSYAGTVSSAGSTVSHLVRGAYYTAQAYEPLSFPSPEPPSLQRIRVYGEENIGKEQEFDDLLKEVDPTLVQKRKGAWKAFQGSNPDRVSQATHSMRETIRLLLDKLAPDEKIKSTSWFVPDSTSQSGITRRHRIKYTLGGPGGECSESLLGMGVALYGQLSSEAHSGDEPKDLREKNAEIALSVADDFLRLILINRYRPGAGDLGERKRP